MKRSVSVIALFFVGLLSWADSSLAATYFVSTSGDDSHPGTQLQPWQTIGKAASTLVAGDTVQVQTGTYNERVNPANSGSAGNYIIYNANGLVNVREITLASKSYIKIIGFHNIPSPFSLTFSQFPFVAEGGSYVIFQNNVVEIPNSGSSWGVCQNEAGGMRISGDHMTVTGNEVSGNCYFSAINISGTDQLAENNFIHDTYTDGFVFTGVNNLTIRGNSIGKFIVIGLHSDCYQTWGGPGYTSNNVIIENNVCHDGDQPGNMSLDGVASAGITIRNNIFYNFTNQFGLGIPNTKVYNNVFWRTATSTNFTALGTSGWGTTVPGIEVKNNFFIGCGVDWYNYDYGTGYGVTATLAGASNNYYARGDSISCGDQPNCTSIGTIPWGAVNFALASEPSMINGGNPLFTDYGTYDFTFQATSPAKDAGTIIASFAVDKNGVSRPQGTAWDIGAYEYGVTEVRGPQTEDGKHNQYGSIILPNPIKAVMLRQYLQQRQDLVVRSLAGRPVESQRLNEPGVYVVKAKDSSWFQKMVVVR
jgi:hypothetical protein